MCRMTRVALIRNNKANEYGFISPHMISPTYSEARTIDARVDYLFDSIMCNECGGPTRTFFIPYHEGCDTHFNLAFLYLTYQ